MAICYPWVRSCYFLRFLRVCLETSRFTSLTISSKLQRLFFLVLNYGEKMKSIYYEASIVFHRKVVCAGWLDWSCRQVSGGDSHYSTCAPPATYLLASRSRQPQCRSACPKDHVHSCKHYLCEIVQQVAVKIDKWLKHLWSISCKK